MRGMTRSPRSIYRDIDLARDARPRSGTAAVAQSLRLVPPAAPSPAPPVTESIEPPAELRGSRDGEIVAVLDAPARFGESADALYRRKERELGALFATFPTADALALAKRFTAAAPGDLLSAQFSRLVIERRQRLIDFLTDAKRREVRQCARAIGGAP